ncbi:MAG: SLC13 family permease [Verrucomicrobia bacterium]|nr:SLC13 family permease [Verrucomicrobiota bacterium]
MDSQLITTLSLLGICVFFFIINKPRMDVVALLAMLALPLLGILSLEETFSGFSDPSVILIGLMFVIGEGLVRTGVSNDVGAWILKKAGGSETKLLVFMMVAVALIGSVMSSTGIVALFIPIVLSISTKLNVSPAKLMMPLSFAGLISGMMSLVATPPNMVVNSILTREQFSGFSFFAFTPIGIIVLVAGVLYMLYARRFLGSQEDENRRAVAKTTFAELANRYELTWRDAVLVISPASSFCGKKVCELPLRAEYGASIVCVERRERLNRQLIDPSGETILRANDALLIDFENDKSQISELCEKHSLIRFPLDGGKHFEHSEREFGLVEVSVMPDSPLDGKTPIEAKFRSRYGMSVIGILRNRKAISKNVVREKLRVGDMLLLAGSWKAADALQLHRKSFIVLNVPVEFENKTAVPGRASYALISLLVMVGLMISGIVPNALAALIGCLMLLAARCIDMDRAYRCINWSSLILIVGMIPFATALEKTGGVEIAADTLMQIFGNADPRIILGALMAFTMIVGLFMSNTVTAVLLAPIAITVARSLGLEPYPFAMGIAIAASTAFMTPISSPVNTLVLGPGRYRFIDFVKLGVPFSVLVLLLGVAFIPLFFPFSSAG